MASAATSPLEFEFDGDRSTACIDRAGTGQTLLIFGHGAGGHDHHPTTVYLTQAVTGCGISVVRFNFAYRQRGRRIPDRMVLLMQCYAAVATAAVNRLQPQNLLLGGYSLGGRVASMLAASGTPCDGLILFSYPLHPARKPDRLRDAHLPDIRVPVLCMNGTRDALCTKDLMDRTTARLSESWTMHWTENADHSFKLPARARRSPQEVAAELTARIAAWRERVPQTGS